MPLIKEPKAEPIPGYRLIEPLGTGGFGEVWKCEAPGGIFKAIKFVFGNLNASNSEAVRAEQELKALERVKNIRHPFLLSIERVEEIEGELVIVMELADKDLRDVLNENRNRGQVGIERSELLQYLRDAAEALDLMNRQHNLQHLDIKPSNLFLVSNRVKVADFGLVKALEGRTSTSPTTGLMGGVTPLYAAPETFRGEITPHSDQYSLAIVYQELLTGSVPFKGKTARQLMLQHLQSTPELEPLPVTDRSVVARALAKTAEERYPSCKDFVRALIQATPGARNWATMEDIFLDKDQSPVFSEEAVGDGSRLQPGLTGSGSMSMLPTSGTLRPTLIVGLGRFGREAIQALRTRIIDRFGSLSKVPLWRFLYVDTDADDLNRAIVGPPEQALSPTEVLHAPIQPVGYYRRNRILLDQLVTWLPLEKMYALPRNLATHGQRAIGKMAFHESYLRIASRFKKELQILVDPETMARTMEATQLEPLTSQPQVFVFSAAGGGTGSGMLIDVAYTLRRLLQELGQSDREMTSYLMLGAPNDPATDVAERANVYACMTEIQHFSDSAVEFTAQYGINGPLLRDGGAPFHCVYLARVTHRSPTVLRETASRLASYVFHELSTPLGSYLGQSRKRLRKLQETPFRSFGAYAVWFPRGLMLRVASRQACQKLIHTWLQTDAAHVDPTLLSAACDPFLAEDHWRPECLQELIESRATTPAEGNPAQAINAFLNTLEREAESPIARDDPANWCHDALKRLKEWVGGSSSPRYDTSDWLKSRLHRLYSLAVQKVADETFENLGLPARYMFEMPGHRMAAAEAAYAYMHQYLAQRIEAQHAQVRDQRSLTQQSWEQVNDAFQACLHSGSFFLFPGMRIQKLLKQFNERIVVFARQRLQEQRVRAVEEYYKKVQARIQDLQHDLTFCTQRLRQVENNLILAPESEEAAIAAAKAAEQAAEAAPLTSSRMLNDAAMVLASRIVLPEGQTDLEQAAQHFLEQLPPEYLGELDAYLQEHVLNPLGGLQYLCMTNSDLPRTLNPPVLEKTAEFLDQRLAVTDVCQAELSTAATLGVDLAAQAKVYYHLATPPIGDKKAEHHDFLLVPESEAGVQFISMIMHALPQVTIIRIANPTDLLVCREQPDLALTDIQELMAPCYESYLSLVVAPQTTPHSRYDIQTWVPLNP